MFGLKAVAETPVSSLNYIPSSTIGQGYSEIDFGTGSNEASVFVSASTILSTQTAEAYLMYEVTADHNGNDHAWAACFISLTCSQPINNVGFTIYARSTQKLAGKFKVRYVWA